MIYFSYVWPALDFFTEIYDRVKNFVQSFVQMSMTKLRSFSDIYDQIKKFFGYDRVQTFI